MLQYKYKLKPMTKCNIHSNIRGSVMTVFIVAGSPTLDRVGETDLAVMDERRDGPPTCSMRRTGVQGRVIRMEVRGKVASAARISAIMAELAPQIPTCDFTLQGT